MGCPDANELIDVLQSGHEMRAELGKHLETCSACQRVVYELELSIAPSRNTVPDPALIPATIAGRYRDLDAVGEGAMGVVYAAFDTVLQRRVALKVVQPMSHLGRDLAARLAREATAMARVSHPNVVTVYDVSTFEGGVAISMELVEGCDLRKWLQLHPQAGWERIVDLFVDAGRGLAAAHAQGLVHRDFKPTNVLVDDDGRARVADFGLACLSGELELRSIEDVTNAPTHQSTTGAFVGTPAYAAPEQINAGRVAARADQFAFAVSCWEALFGARPFAGSSIVEISTAIAMRRITPPPKGHGCDRRVIAVLRRAMEPAAGDRYANMDALLEALTAIGERRRRARRVRWTMGAAALAATASVTGYAWMQPAPCSGADEQLRGSWSDADRARLLNQAASFDRAYLDESMPAVLDRLDRYARSWRDEYRDICEAFQDGGGATAQRHAVQVSCLLDRRRQLDFTVELLASGDESVIREALPTVAALPAVTICGEMRSAGEEPGSRLTEQHSVELGEIDTLIGKARVHQRAGDYDSATRIATEALDRARSLGLERPLARALVAAGEAYAAAQLPQQADPLLVEAVAVATRAGDDMAAARAWSSLVYVRGTLAGRLEPALEAGQMARALLERASDHPEYASARAHFVMWHGSVVSQLMRHDEAVAELQEAIALFRALENPISEALARFYLAQARLEMGQYQVALDLLAHVRDHYERLLGARHPRIVPILNQIANAQMYLSRLPQARDTYQQALQLGESTLGPVHPELIPTLVGLATHARKTGDRAKAIAILERAETIVSASLAQDEPTTVEALRRDVLQADVLYGLGSAYYEDGDPETARRYLVGALASGERVFGKGSAKTTAALSVLGAVEAKLGRTAEAKELLERALEISRSSFGPDSREAAADYATLGALHLDHKDYPQALTALETAVGIYERVFGRDDPRLAVPLTNLSVVLRNLEQYAEALDAAERALALDEQTLGHDHPDLAWTLIPVGGMLAALGRPEEAIRSYERALEVLEAGHGRPHLIATAHSGLATLLAKTDPRAARKHRAAAEALRD